MKKKLMVLVLVALIAMGAQVAFATEQAEHAEQAEQVAGGVTKFDNGKGKIGPAIYIAHQDMWMIKAVRDLEALIARIAVPKPYGSLAVQVIKLRTSLIQTKDKGNGVKLQWTHAAWIPTVVSMEGFWTYSQ